MPAEVWWHSAWEGVGAGAGAWPHVTARVETLSTASGPYTADTSWRLYISMNYQTAFCSLSKENQILSDFFLFPY